MSFRFIGARKYHHMGMYQAIGVARYSCPNVSWGRETRIRQINSPRLSVPDLTNQQKTRRKRRWVAPVNPGKPPGKPGKNYKFLCTGLALLL